MKECDKLGKAGIIAEFNPFHNGHKFLIDCAKSDGHSVYTVISGNFVQRGDTSIISKFDRARQALGCGADIVAELPCPWSMSTAQNFAFGAVSQLNLLGVDTLYFGSESGNTDSLIEISEILSSEDFNEKLKNNLKSNKTFATIRQEVLSEIDQSLSDILSGANDTLAVEYIAAAKRLNPEIRFKAIKRVGAMHNDSESDGSYSTATLIRKSITDGRTEDLSKFVPFDALKILLKSDISEFNRLEYAILAKLRTMSVNDFKLLPDISEGLENLIYSSVQKASNLDELYSLIKSKRYTLARIRRIVLCAFLDIDNSYFKKQPPYVRILGFRDNALSALPKNKNIITKVSSVRDLDEFSKKVFNTECRATDLYNLSFKMPKNCGAEMTTPIIKI